MSQKCCFCRLTLLDTEIQLNMLWLMHLFADYLVAWNWFGCDHYWISLPNYWLHLHQIHQPFKPIPSMGGNGSLFKFTYWESTHWESTYWESTYWDSTYWESTYWESTYSSICCIINAYNLKWIHQIIAL